MGVLEKLAYHAGRAKGHLDNLGSVPERTVHEYYEGKKEGLQGRREEVEPEYRESAEEAYERSTGAKKTGDALWDRAVGKSKPNKVKSEPVKTERVKEQKPVVKNYYYGNGARTTKREASRSSKPKLSRSLDQPNFNNVNNRLVNAANRQTDSINDYNRRIRDMFG